MPWTNSSFAYATLFKQFSNMTTTQTEHNQNAPAPEDQERIRNEASWVELLRREIGKVIVGQKYLVDRLIIGLLANGHVLLEGVPGLAKTLAVKNPRTMYES